MLGEVQEWGVLACCRARLLLTGYDQETDGPSELKLRLRLWEHGDFQELLDRCLAGLCRQRENGAHFDKDAEQDLIRAGNAARKLGTRDCLSRAMQRIAQASAPNIPDENNVNTA